MSSAVPAVVDASRFGRRTTAEEVVAGMDLSGKTYLVTGCNSGLGLETMRVLALKGARVLGAARTVEKGKRACESVEGDAESVVCELSEPESVRRTVEEVKSKGHELDGIICNAGIMALPKLELVHGYEKQFFTNHIGHFILVTGLLESLKEDGRVVMVSSYGHKMAIGAGIDFDNLRGEKSYLAWRAYGRSKLSNLLFAKELARRFEESGSGRIAHAVHPGVINTNLGRHLNPVMRWGMKLGEMLLFKTIAQGAATQVFTAVHPAAGEVNGEYFSHCDVEATSRQGRNMALAARLWEESERIVKDFRN